MLDQADFLARLTAIMRAETGKSDLQIDMQTSQDTLESWDSLAHVRIVIGVERAFGIQLDVEEIEGIRSVQGFYAAVQRHLG